MESKNKGITLIALVITIIILLILAGISIEAITGDNGLFSRAKEAKIQTEIATIKEQIQSDILAKQAQNNGEISEEELKEILESYGILSGEEDILDNILTTKKGKYEIKVSDIWNGTTTKKPMVADKPNTEVVKPSITFSTNFGTIDVIWLKDTSNTIVSTPNVPKLTEGMEKVTWSYDSVKEEWKEQDVADNDWYNYKAGNGTDDNTESRWANAKYNDSYFVWIPRYAYRITYYEDRTCSKLTGYYDGYGQWDANGNLRVAIDNGVETVEYNNNKYIVHPAFGTNLDLGGWDGNGLTGIWVAKYQMCEQAKFTRDLGTRTFYSIPGVESGMVDSTIGNMFTDAKNYATEKESHLIKNSEWGAVTYLTHSKFGRNGNKIDINNTAITGKGAGTVNLESNKSYDYNTKIGAKASSTGNVYGIYDLHGCSYEYIASFNTAASNTSLKNGGSFASNGQKSTKYVTTYFNEEDDYVSSLDKIFALGKVGDALKETVQLNSGFSWFDGFADVPISNKPFILRGGNYLGSCRTESTISHSPDMFDSDCNNGFADLSTSSNKRGLSFRIVLCP